MTNSKRRRGKDEMNLAVLPIARLGRNDRRTRIEYHGTFREPGKEQEEMVWTQNCGLPTIDKTGGVLLATIDKTGGVLLKNY